MAPVDPVNGTVSYVPEHHDEMGYIPYETEVIYSCNVGYSLNGSRTSICNESSQSAVGVLNPAPPTCERKCP